MNARNFEGSKRCSSGHPLHQRITPEKQLEDLSSFHSMCKTFFPKVLGEVISEYLVFGIIQCCEVRVSKKMILSMKTDRRCQCRYLVLIVDSMLLHHIFVSDGTIVDFAGVPEDGFPCELYLSCSLNDLPIGPHKRKWYHNNHSRWEVKDVVELLVLLNRRICLSKSLRTCSSLPRMCW